MYVILMYNILFVFSHYDMADYNVGLNYPMYTVHTVPQFYLWEYAATVNIYIYSYPLPLFTLYTSILLSVLLWPMECSKYNTNMLFMLYNTQ